MKRVRIILYEEYEYSQFSELTTQAEQKLCVVVVKPWPSHTVPAAIFCAVLLLFDRHDTSMTCEWADSDARNCFLQYSIPCWVQAWIFFLTLLWQDRSINNARKHAHKCLFLVTIARLSTHYFISRFTKWLHSILPKQSRSQPNLVVSEIGTAVFSHVLRTSERVCRRNQILMF